MTRSAVTAAPLAVTLYALGSGRMSGCLACMKYLYYVWLNPLLAEGASLGDKRFRKLFKRCEHFLTLSFAVTAQLVSQGGL
jgi:hypothetical protein